MRKISKEVIMPKISVEQFSPERLPEVGFLRIKQIIPDIIPISRSAWWLGIKTGRYPKGVKLSERTTVWRKKDIEALCDKFNSV